MTGPKVDIGRDLAVFVDPQAAFSTAAGFPVAADGLRAITASANGKAPFAMFEDKRGTSTPLGVINQKRTAEFSLECYAYLPAAGTSPDWADLLTSGGWQAITGGATTIRGTSSTTTQVDVNSVSGMSVGSSIVVGGEIRRITGIDSSSGAEHVDVTPALSSAPTTAGKPVGAAITFKPKDSRDTTPDSITLWAGNNNTLSRITGAVPTQNSFSLGGDEAARLTVSGTGRRDDLLNVTALDEGSGINASVTSFDVHDGTAAPKDTSASEPFYFSIGTEVIKVIGVSGNTWTTDTRATYATGASPSSHSNNAVITPFQPEMSVTGTPIPATSGYILVDGQTLKASTVSVEVDQGIIYREGEHGDAFQVNGWVGGRRAVTATLEGWSFYDSTIMQALSAVTRTSKQVLVQQGDVAGSILAIELPTFKFEEPDLDRGGDEVTVSLTGQAVGTTKEDEIFIMVG